MTTTLSCFPSSSAPYQMDLVKADRDYHRQEVEILKTQLLDIQSNKQNLESATQVRQWVIA